MAYSDVSGLGATMYYKGKPVKGVGGFIQVAKAAKKQGVTIQSLVTTKPKKPVIAKPIIGYKPPVYRPTPNIAPVDPGFNIGPQVDAGGSVSTPAISPASGGGPTTSGGVTTPVEVGTLDSNGEIPGRSAMKLSPVALLAIAGAAFFLLKGK